MAMPNNWTKERRRDCASTTFLMPHRRFRTIFENSLKDFVSGPVLDGAGGILSQNTFLMKQLLQIQNWPERARAAKWCASTLAKHCGVSLRTLERHFLKEMGKHPKAWLSEQRQQQALELVRDGSSIKETAGLLDYKHSTHFSRAYKGQWGCSPTEKTAQQRAKNP